MFIKKTLFTILILFILTNPAIGEEETVYRITILGNVKIEEGVIKGVIKTQEGMPLSLEQVKEDIKSIFNLGYFSDVQVDIKSTPRGKEVIYIVMEKPSIKEINIIGAEKVKTDDIKEKITLKTRTILNLEKVKENAEQIRKLYFSKGYYGVRVEYSIDYLDTNEAIVNFKISEGPKGRIKKIIFKGNKNIKSSDLKKAMMTKQWNIFSILTKTGILDEDILKNDIQLLSAYYYDHGFLDVKISEPKINLKDPRRIEIEIEIDEGRQYRIGDIDFKGDVLTTKEDLFKVLKIKRGDIYRTSVIREEINKLTEIFANKGYAYVEITPETLTDSKNLRVNITFDIEKKKQVYFEKIQITGNTKTRDKVVRRELQVSEGELYQATGLKRSQERLKRTGFFKEVDFSTSRGSSDEKLNLDIKVEEAPTGALSVGIGYSSVEKVIGSASISDRNLFGMGYHGVFKFNLGADLREFKLSFTDPYFLGYPFALGTDLYNEKREFDTYSSKIKGGDLRFGKEITDRFRLDIMYKLETINIYEVAIDASRFIKEQEGKKTTSAISFTPSYDSRDDYFNPTRGGRHSITLQYAGGVLGFDNEYVKVSGETSWYFSLPLNLILNLRGKAGFIEPYGGKKAPIYEKFFVGGMYTIRGFEFGTAGPLDENREPLGARKMLVFNSELQFPLSREIGLRAAIFWDIGKGFDKWKDISPLKTGAGVGLRWFSPLGPIHIDMGYNLNPKPGEKRRVIDFTFGTVF